MYLHVSGRRGPTRLLAERGRSSVSGIGCGIMAPVLSERTDHPRISIAGLGCKGNALCAECAIDKKSLRDVSLRERSSVGTLEYTADNVRRAEAAAFVVRSRERLRGLAAVARQLASMAPLTWTFSRKGGDSFVQQVNSLYDQIDAVLAEGERYERDMEPEDHQAFTSAAQRIVAAYQSLAQSQEPGPALRALEDALEGGALWVKKRVEDVGTIATILKWGLPLVILMAGYSWVKR